jgi:predicted RNase H-like HicB family nuclease
MKQPAKDYSLIIQWSEQDRAYLATVATVPELPGCQTHGETYEEALKHGLEAIDLWTEDAQVHSDPIPSPLVAISSS